MTPARKKPATDRAPEQFASLLDFLEKLDHHRASYRLASIRTESVMVEVYAPGEHWEIEFMDDGALEIERYRSPGEIHGREVLADLWRLLTPIPTEIAMVSNAIASQKKARKPRARR